VLPRNDHRILVWAVALALLAPAAGCRDDAPGAPAASHYAALTAGTPGALAQHITHLQQQYGTAEAADVRDFRANLLGYTDAVAATADALLAQKDAGVGFRKGAAEAKLDALSRRIEVEPEALGRFLAATDELEKEPTETGIPPIAAYWRVVTLRANVDKQAGATPEEFRAIADAVERLAKAKPPHEKAAQALKLAAAECEQRGEDARARRLYELLAEQFPDDPDAEFAPGNARRVALKGKPIDDFAGPSLRDPAKTIDLKDYRGKVVLIDFWSTRSDSCKREMPMIKMLYDRHKADGFTVLGVDLDESPQQPRGLVEHFELSWPHIYDVVVRPGKMPDSRLVRGNGVSRVPYLMVVDRQGRYIASANSLMPLQPIIVAALEGKPYPKVLLGPAPPDEPPPGRPGQTPQQPRPGRGPGPGPGLGPGVGG
jgi:thiol-disulfide isomerase/thioredoxin